VKLGLTDQVILDDDPTGTQTCHDINILTVWDQTTLVTQFESHARGFFILTNSRAFPTLEARKLIRTVCIAVKAAAALAGKQFEVVLRGDSTLRGHFPDGPEIAEEVFGKADAWIMAPFFPQEGRLTLEDVHYVADAEKGQLIPAAQTSFAKDPAFGYRRSNLREYINEKSEGRISADRMRSISLQDIREGGANVVTQRLLTFARSSIVIVNAAVDTDMEIFVRGLLEARKRGMTFIYHTAAAFVSTRLAMKQIPPLSPAVLGMDLSSSAHGGLIIAGSHMSKTTAQLEALVSARKDQLEIISLDVETLLQSQDSVQQIVLNVANNVGRLVASGRAVLLMTSRKIIAGHDKHSSLRTSSIIADSLVLFLRLFLPRPRYIIVKEGTTSSNIATKGLGMTKATIRGQAALGVPLWQCEEPSSKFPGIPYAIFPEDTVEDSRLLDLAASWDIQQMASQHTVPMQYQRLGSSGLKISRIILGCMTFGNPYWEGSPWIIDEDKSLPLLKKAYDAGINTWETADSYSNGLSEEIIGKALRKYNIPRSKVVIMTKVYYPVMEDTPNIRPQPATNDGALVNQMGLSRKHIFEAVEGSLRRLGTSYIDVLQLHRLDRETDLAEIMHALHDLVKLGKVHYLGASSMYTWQFARLQYTAKLCGLTTFTSMSGLYNLLYREEEREMIPFCTAEGIGLIPWSPIARGLLTRPWAEQSKRGEKDLKLRKWFQGEQNKAIARRVEELAKHKGCSMSSVAIAWLLHKRACPIVGLNSLERIENVSESLAVNLTDDDMTYLEELYRPLEVQAM